jgi:hypothetical protein
MSDGASGRSWRWQCTCINVKSPRYMAFPTFVDPTDDSCRLTLPSPLPRKASHGNTVTNADRKEVGVSADGHASATPYGAN